MCRGGTPFDNILCTAPGGLNHLVVGPATPIDVALTEAHRHIKAELRHLEAFQLPVPAMWRNERVAVGRFFGRSPHGGEGYIRTHYIQVIYIVCGHISGREWT